MSQYNDLKQAIQAVIRTNGNEEITGALLQQSLLSMVNSLGAGYQFMGVATPVTNPGTPDQKVFYLAGESGIYTNFGGYYIGRGKVAVLFYDTTWNIAAFNISINNIFENVEDSAFYICDNEKRVIAKIDKYGLTDINLKPFYNNKFYVCDSFGKVVLSISSDNVNFINKHWYTNKVMFTLGDSLSAANKWQLPLVKDGIIWDAAKNTDDTLPISVGGTMTWGDVLTSGFARARNLVSYAQNHQCDIVIIENINDINALNTKGTLESLEYIEYADGSNNGNPRTLYGAYKGLLNYLFQNLPSTNFYWLIPNRYYVDWANLLYNDMYQYLSNDEYQELVQIQKDICAMYGVPVLDMQENAGINLFNGSVFYYSNDVHPKDRGYEQWGKTILKLM